MAHSRKDCGESGVGALTLVQKIAIWIVPVVFAITVHEVAHGWVARMRGDPTAASLGRLSLNPLRHVDPFGTILVPGLLLLTTSFVFGWARPVPVDWRNLRNPRRDMALVAAAGPFANLLMATAWALLARIAISWDVLPMEVARPLALMGVAGVFINCVLMVLNLLPLPPLDGGRVAAGLLPVRVARVFSRLEPWGLVIIVLLLITGWLGKILWPILIPILTAVVGVSGLSWQDFQFVFAAIS